MSDRFKGLLHKRWAVFSKGYNKTRSQRLMYWYACKDNVILIICAFQLVTDKPPALVCASPLTYASRKVCHLLPLASP